MLGLKSNLHFSNHRRTNRYVSIQAAALPRPHFLQVWREQIRQMATYLAIGVSTTTIDFVVFNLLFWLLAPRQAMAMMMLSGVSTLGSSVNSYFGHRRWTFSKGNRTRAQFWAFMALNAATLILCMVLVGVFAGVLPHLLALSASVTANIGKILATAISGIAAFLGNKFWVFHA